MTKINSTGWSVLVGLLGLTTLAATTSSNRPSQTSANITVFEAEPENVCAGSSVELSWETRSDTLALTADPSSGVGIPTSLPEDAEDVSVGPVNADTVFRLEARLAASARDRTTRVDVIPPEGRAFMVSASGVCTAEGPRWFYSPAPEVWDSSGRVSGVTNFSGENIFVAKGPAIAAMPAGLSTTAFNGQTVSGQWEVTLDDPGAAGRAKLTCSCGFGERDESLGDAPQLPSEAGFGCSNVQRSLVEVPLQIKVSCQ